MASVTTNDINSTPTATIDELLIDFVRQNPALFEKGNRVKPYESMKERSEIWKSIATSLGVEPNYCMLRWKYLRERFQKEIVKETQPKTGSADKVLKDCKTHWPLMEKMRFLDNYNTHRRHYSPINKHIADKQKTTTISSPTKTELLFSGINYEEPLQEAMDEQPLTSNDATRKSIALTNSITSSSYLQNDNKSTEGSTVLTRIGALLGGLDTHNRSLAEKRILSYLCKCQLRILDGENIEEIQF